MTHKSTPAFATELRFMGEAADATRPLALSWFRHPMQIDDKEDKSPVTQADRAIEAMLRARIMKAFPHHGIFGEEEAPVNLGSAEVWIVDPIDGTKSFVTGHPLFGCLMGLLANGAPVLGQIDMPVLGERWQGRAGAPSTFNGKVCQTRACTSLQDAWVYTTNPLAFPGASRPAFEAITDVARLTRYGGDCYNYGLLASGHCDLVIETGLQPFDYLPLVSIITGAGGVITDWSGHALGLESVGDVVAAATPALHEAALAHLAGHAPAKAA